MSDKITPEEIKKVLGDYLDNTPVEKIIEDLNKRKHLRKCEKFGKFVSSDELTGSD